MSCEKVQNLLCEYLDSELNELEAKYVEKHLGECFNCLKEFEGLKKTAAVVSALPDVSVPKDFRKELSMKIDNQKASMFELFTKRRFWLPVASVALAATFLIIAFNEQTSFLNVERARDAGQIFRETAPLLDVEIKEPALQAEKSKEKKEVKSPARPEKLPFKYAQDGKLKKKSSTSKLRAKGKSKAAETTANKQETAVINKPADENIALTTEETDVLSKKAVEDGFTYKGKEAEKAPALPSTADTKITFMKTDADDKSKKSGETFNTPAEEAFPSKAAGGVTSPSATGTTSMTLEGKIKPAPKMETTGKDEEKKELKSFTSKETAPPGAEDEAQTESAVSAVSVTLYATDTNAARKELTSVMKPYETYRAAGLSFSAVIPQNKISFFLGKLKSAGTVKVHSKWNPESSISVTVTVTIKQKEEK